MSRAIRRSAQAVLIGGVALLALSAQASRSLTPDQEEQLHPGMSTEQVRDLVGEPSRIMQFPGNSGTSWVYDLAGSDATTAVYIDFDSAGHVITTDEIVRRYSNSSPSTSSSN
ncbi:MAG: outer membrane protein assembly factor BamE [Leptothrix sp. (in: b-proteobacteria)]